MTLRLEIITPEKVVFEGHVSFARFSTLAGEIEILAGHMPLLGIVVPGMIEFSKNATNSSTFSDIESIVIDEGFFQVLGDRVSLLIEAAVDVHKTNKETIKDAKIRAEKALEDAKKQPKISQEELDRLESALKFSIMQDIAKSRQK